VNITSALNSDRLCASLTGLQVAEFKDLVESFRLNWDEYLHTRHLNRKRKLGAGRIGQLKTVEEKLLFALFYLKAYPTFDVLAFIVQFHRTRACQQTLMLLPILEKTLGRKLVLPERKISSIEEFLAKFPQAKDVFGDGTERKIQRPKSKKKQNKTYSGKKKLHARKQIVLADEHKRILVLTPTKSGRRHDKKLADKSGLFTHLPPSVSLWLDTGFVGVQKDHPNTLIPKKKTKGHPLTEEDKQNNKLISSFRVVVEHAIGGMKRYQCLNHSYRNHKAKLDDLFSLLSAGLWNYHLSFSSNS
jgi:hypothetical protein